MKQTKLVKAAQFVWILGFIIFFSAIITQFFNIELYNTLYIVGVGLYVIAAILSFMAAIKDKEHLKNIEIIKKDERVRYIKVTSKAKAFDIFTLIFSMILMLTSSLKLIDTNACIIFGGLCLLLIVLQFYYFFKFSKKM